MSKSKKQQEDDDAADAQVVKDEATAEKAYQRTIDERVADVFPGDDPVEPLSTGKGAKKGKAQPDEPVPDLTPKEQLRADYAALQVVRARGDVVSPDDVTALLGRAMSLLAD